ncbi:hypothetical protein ACWD6R_12755 [Streptomyces sp. NPDC005151]
MEQGPRTPAPHPASQIALIALLRSAQTTTSPRADQPLTQPWNRGGFGNNLVQRIAVRCGPG